MPKKKKKTMAVHEMAELLGLKKTDSYWLIHKQKFQTITVNGKTRVVIESFEKWYSGQNTYIKVKDRPLEEQQFLKLQQYANTEPRLEVNPDKSNYDVKEVSTLLDLSSSEVYQMIRRGKIQTFRCGRQLRVPREELENWLKDLKKDIKQHKER